MTFDIEKGVPPLPKTYNARKYPFSLMEESDSFFITSDDSGILQRRLTASCAGFSKRNPGKKFSVRKVDGGVRVWRIA